MLKASKIADVIAVSNEHPSKILGEYVNIRPLLYVLFLDSNGNTGVHTVETNKEEELSFLTLALESSCVYATAFMDFKEVLYKR